MVGQRQPAQMPVEAEERPEQGPAGQGLAAHLLQRVRLAFARIGCDRATGSRGEHQADVNATGEEDDSQAAENCGEPMKNEELRVKNGGEQQSRVHGDGRGERKGKFFILHSSFFTGSYAATASSIMLLSR